MCAAEAVLRTIAVSRHGSVVLPGWLWPAGVPPWSVPVTLRWLHPNDNSFVPLTLWWVHCNTHSFNSFITVHREFTRRDSVNTRLCASMMISQFLTPR
jgi:hypothetical protein